MSFFARASIDCAEATVIFISADFKIGSLSDLKYSHTAACCLARVFLFFQESVRRAYFSEQPPELRAPISPRAQPAGNHRFKDGLEAATVIVAQPVGELQEVGRDDRLLLNF